MAQTTHAFSDWHSSFDVRLILDRIKGTLTFQRATAASIASDRNATLEAALVVVAVGLASTIGLREGVLSMLAATLIGWVGLSGVIWFIAERFLGTPTSYESVQPLLRTIGYAQAPAALVIIHFIWGLGPVVGFVGFAWSFAATIFAVHHTTRFGWLRSVALTVTGGIAVSILGFILSVITGIDPQIW